MKKKKRSLSSDTPSSDSENLDLEKLPTHIAIIMDGNGRWAKKQKLSRINGHIQGLETVREIVKTCRRIGISYLTLYAFSTENWGRPKKEVTALMSLLKRFLRSEREEMLENNIRLNAIGELKRLPKDAQELLYETMKATQKNDALLLTLALSYGSRSEIVHMVKAVAADAKKGLIKPKDITPELVSSRLFTESMPDPDLLIRTSGEFRISNFLLWQIAYAEIFVTNTLWPDFGEEEFIDILNRFQLRERRFGKVKG